MSKTIALSLKLTKQVFFETIIQNKDYTKLLLPSTELNDKDCKNLAEAIIANRNITQINVANSVFTKKGFAMIANALKEAKNLVDLDIRDIPEDCYDSIAMLLNHNLLSKLEIESQSSATETTQETLFAALEANQSLTHVKIDTNSISFNYERLYNIFTKKTALKNIYLGIGFSNDDEYVLEPLKEDVSTLAYIAENLKKITIYCHQYSLNGITHMFKAWNKDNSLEGLKTDCSELDNQEKEKIDSPPTTEIITTKAGKLDKLTTILEEQQEDVGLTQENLAGLALDFVLL